MLSRSWHPAVGLVLSRSSLRLAPAGALVAALLLPGAAHAAKNPSKTVTASESLGGVHAYDNFTIAAGAVVTVLPYTSGQAGSGWLTITANTITIDGSIVADGGGYVGVAGMPGGCSPISVKCAAAGSATGDPGGGGGFYGAGANGASENAMGVCTDLMGAAQGGAAFFSMATMMLDLGSAGGAANNSGTIAPGYAGGGGIRLSAGLVVINGTVSANGAGTPGGSYHGGVAPGGGSGGAIEITAAQLMGTGTLSVKGGDGAHGAGATPAPANDGGGGSGGTVLLHLPAGMANPFTVVATGGKTGNCTGLAGTNGSAVVVPLGATCVDLDGDGFPSVSCAGGTDCDDTDPDIHPGAAEICNGIDDNCSGKIDEAPNDCTAKGEVCFNPPGDAGASHCIVVMDGGVSDGGDLPTFIEFGGGCALPDRATRSVAGIGALALALMAFAARRRPGASRRQ
jgi:hypothetical protein